MRPTSPPRIRFGPFEVDTQSGELRRNGSKVDLQDQPFQALVLLLESSGEAVTREELCKKLWPLETFVDFERGLNKAINKLRAALRDDAEKPRYIETLPQRGYRFIAPVQTVPQIQRKHAPQIDSLAVLPLANLSGDPT
jgi:cholera toxin transcriptional activator